MRDKAKKFFTEYSREKILALLLTFIVWIFMISGNNEIRDFSLKLEVRTRDDVILISDPVKIIHVKAVGSIFDFAGIRDQDLVIRVDLSSMGAGLHTRFLDASSIPFDDSIKIDKIFPSELNFNISPKSRKFVNVDPWLEGQLPLGWKLKGWSVDPETVEVEGPKNEVEELETITTERILLGSIKENTEKSVPVTSAIPFIKPLENKTVKVTIEVERDMESKLFQNVKVDLDSEKESEIIPSDISVTLRGPKDVLQKIESDGLKVFVKDDPEKANFKTTTFYIKDLHSEVEIIQQKKPIEINVKK